MPTHLLVIGRGGELICTTRRGATVAGLNPISIMRAGLAGGVPSQGHLPADCRPAVLTRVHQCGGSPIHHAPARRAHPTARPPPGCMSCYPLHASQHHQVSKRSPRSCPPAPNPAIYQAKRSLDKPFHISTPTVDRDLWFSGGLPQVVACTGVGGVREGPPFGPVQPAPGVTGRVADHGPEGGGDLVAGERDLACWTWRPGLFGVPPQWWERRARAWRVHRGGEADGGRVVARAPPRPRPCQPAGLCLAGDLGDAAMPLPDERLDLVWVDDGSLWLSGPETTSWSRGYPPATTAVGVGFRPGVGLPLLHLAASEVRDTRVRLDELWGDRQARELAERVAACPDDRGRAEELERAVRRLAARARPVDQVALEVAARLDQPHPASARDLSRATGLSQRQLYRRCTAAFGYGPAVLARMLRLQRALQLARSHQGPFRLAELAAAAGYFDQQHFAHEVRAIMGTTPARLLRFS